MQGNLYFFKFNPFYWKFLLNHSLYCCGFMFDCTQTWIFSNFHYLYDSSHSHFLICNEYAMIFSPETELFLEILIFSPPNLFHWKLTCMVKVNMHVDSFFLIAHGFSLSNKDQNYKIPIFFSSSIHFCRKFCWITLFTAVISCLTVLKREFFPIFSTFMIVLIHIF